MLMVIMLVHIKVACWLQSVEHHVYNTSWRSRMRFMAEKVVVRYGGRVYSAFCTLYGAPHCIIHSWTKRIDIDCDYSVSNPSSLPRSCKIGMAGDAWCFCYMFQYVPICSNMFQYVPICSNVELDRVGLALRSLRNFTILYSLAECGTFCGALASCLHHCWRPQDQRLLLLTSQQQPSESRCQAAWALVQNVQKSSKTLSAFDATNVVRTSGVGMLYLKEYVEYGSQNQSAFFLLTSSCWQNITEL